ncbi:universal stress protein [Croceibacterium ferulae]|uniref:universal stress protein n=1 Tax=Croceibacterium ferulae TaxID=1854641 RepID=UPI000F88F00B|nr:universal stress protein [Croceibacterium ferulae]
MDDNGLEARLGAALDLARTVDGHVLCLQATPHEIDLPGDFFGTEAAEIVVRLQEGAAALRQKIEPRLAAQDVAWSWEVDERSAAEALVEHSRLNDLVVMGNCDPASGNPSGLPAAVGTRAHTPILLVPSDTVGFDCTAPALVAWDGSPEACRALRSAVPLLEHSKAVTLAWVSGERGKRLERSMEEAAAYLARHGVRCQMVELPCEGGRVAQVLRDATVDFGAGWMVMGAFGEQRLRELMRGGVTQALFEQPPVPILARH